MRAPNASPERRPSIRVVLLAALLATATPPARAAADPVVDRTTEAHRLVREGRFEEALARWQAVADEHPEHPSAPGALYDAARLLDRTLRRYGDAIALYRRLGERYPTHRLTPRALGRAEDLETGIAAGPEPFRIYEETIDAYREIGPDEAIRRMRAILVDHPEFPHRRRVRTWLAHEYRRQERWAEAEEIYRSIAEAEPTSEDGLASVAALGRIRVEQGRYEEAVAIFERLFDTHEERWFFAAREHVRTTEELLFRRRVFQASLVASAVLVLLGLMRVPWRAIRWREVVDVRLELLLYAPPMVWLVMISSGTKDEITNALIGIALGLAPLLVLNRLLLEASPVRPDRIGRRLLLHALVVVPALLAFHYCMLYVAGISDMIEHTIEYGPEL